MDKKKEAEYFKVNTAALLKEVLESNDNMGVFRVPFNQFKGLLVQVAERASELNDPVLNALMCDLALYAEADPYDKNYNREIVGGVYKKRDELVNP